jgi:hypothetical protein
MFKPILAGAGLTMTYSSMGTAVSGHITSNTTWALPNSPYVVDGDVVVETNVFLNIEPRVTVKFASGTNLVIDGALVAEGNATHMTIFTSNATLPQMGDWGGIRFRDTSIDDSCTINWAVVEYADFGIATESSSPTITNSRIQHNNNGVTMRAAALQMFNDTFTNNTQGVFVDGPSLDTVHFEIHNSLFENNTVGIEGRNSIASTVIAVFNTQFSRNGVGIEGQGMGHILNIENSTFLGNQYGVRGGETMFHYGYTNAKLSTFTNNDVAIIDDGLQLLGCNVSENNQGISAYEGAWISKSIVVNNNGTGINANGVTVLYSTIRGNQQNGIMPHTSSTVHFSNLYDNGPYDVYYSGSYGTDVNATSNWWGTTNTTEISQHIYDYYDDYNVGKVFYEPFLDSEIAIPPLSHDIGITGITASKTVVGQGFNLNINITIFSYGDLTETFNVTVYCNETAITLPNGENYTTVTLASGESTTVAIAWNTSGFAYGNYTIWAHAEPVSGETDIEDNTFVDGYVFVSIPGDVNGDKKVNILDCILIANHFGHADGDGHAPGSKEWFDCANCDINSDSKTNVLDCIILSNNFNKSWI